MSDDATSPAHVGRQLAERRKILDLTQDELAKRVDVSARTVSAIERGINAIQQGNRSAWEAALSLKPGTISRAYRDGSPIETVAGGERRGEAQPSLQELVERMAELTREIEEAREKDRKRLEEVEEELKRLREQRSG